MKQSEIQELNEEELGQRVNSLRKELFDLRMARAAGKLDKPHHLQRVRREIARIETVRRQKTSASSERKA
ncbi:MAG: 50S ribosomal protein L29 [Candidatus Omnitrophica bacterium]|nr:50S ribosomal protein L29 [Candidatus Omnitrophota bacterium]